MTLNLESSTTELIKGSNLEWYHNLTNITCVQKLRVLPQKLDAVRVQTGPSLSKYEGFKRKLIYYSGIHFSKLISTQHFFFHSIWTIQRHILKFQPFLTS